MVNAMPVTDVIKVAKKVVQHESHSAGGPAGRHVCEANHLHTITRTHCMSDVIAVEAQPGNVSVHAREREAMRPPQILNNSATIAATEI